MDKPCLTMKLRVSEIIRSRQTATSKRVRWFVLTRKTEQHLLDAGKMQWRCWYIFQSWCNSICTKLILNMKLKMNRKSMSCNSYLLIANLISMNFMVIKYAYSVPVFLSWHILHLSIECGVISRFSGKFYLINLFLLLVSTPIDNPLEGILVSVLP